MTYKAVRWGPFERLSVVHVHIAHRCSPGRASVAAAWIGFRSMLNCSTLAEHVRNAVPLHAHFPVEIFCDRVVKHVDPGWNASSLADCQVGARRKRCCPPRCLHANEVDGSIFWKERTGPKTGPSRSMKNPPPRRYSATMFVRHHARGTGAFFKRLRIAESLRAPPT